MARVVYSSGPDGAREVCPRCGAAGCDCRRAARALPPGDHDVRVRRERGGRGGKTVTTAAPFVVTRDDARNLLKRLKKTCGCGGTVRETDGAWTLELQGDRREAVLATLARLGYPAKAAGG